MHRNKILSLSAMALALALAPTIATAGETPIGTLQPLVYSTEIAAAAHAPLSNTLGRIDASIGKLPSGGVIRVERRTAGKPRPTKGVRAFPVAPPSPETMMMNTLRTYLPAQ